MKYFIIIMSSFVIVNSHAQILRSSSSPKTNQKVDAENNIKGEENNCKIAELIRTDSTYDGDKEIEAKLRFTNAEEYFNEGSLIGYENSLIELTNAETILNKTNSKILYLKIKSLNNLYSENDFYYVYDLDTALKLFFSVTNSKEYPIEKYSEILNIKNSFISFQKLIGEQFKSINSPQYKNNSSICLQKGMSLLVSDNKCLARKYISLSAQKGNDTAMLQMGLIYRCEDWAFQYAKNNCRIRDVKKAIFWFSKSEKKNNSYALYYLANYYYLGDGVEQNYSKAVELLKNSAQMNNPFAMEVLSYFYEKGIGVEKNKKASKEWIDKSKEILKHLMK